ncbi:hypothetical protein [Enterocloster bolteae]|uniref:hypothetical protein n=1 Tax=Enterocloster bolteae TaxID=208479 RepID=UPI0034A4A07C
MNEFNLELELNIDADNIGFLSISQTGLKKGKKYIKEQKSYYTENLNKQFIVDSVENFVNEKLT